MLSKRIIYPSSLQLYFFNTSIYRGTIYEAINWIYEKERALNIKCSEKHLNKSFDNLKLFCLTLQH